MRIFRSNQLWSGLMEVYTSTCSTKRDRIKVVLGTTVGYLCLEDAVRLSKVLDTAIEEAPRIKDKYRDR